MCIRDRRGEAQEEKEMVKSLVSDMSHQLKTPLANIRLYQEILKQDGIEAVSYTHLDVYKRQ